MAKVSMSTQLYVPAQHVWNMIGNFGGLADWHPLVERSEIEKKGNTQVRRLHLRSGDTIVEKLESSQPNERKYTYSIIDSPLPVADYTAVLAVRDDGGGRSTVEWSSEFNPEGVPETDAVKMIQEIYEAGFENLRRMFGT